MPQPRQIYDFTAFSASFPQRQQPGDRLDAQFREHAGAIEALRRRVNAMDPALTLDALERWLGYRFRELERAARTAALAGDAEAAPVAQDWADVSVAWAEHMPDPIPPNILATMGISGNHWSSRWWAEQALLNAQSGFPEAPNDGTAYARKSLGWAHLTHGDIIDWSASMPAAYVLPVASTTVLGGVKVDGVTVTIAGGVISAAAGGGGLTDAPNDATAYIRKSLGWSHLTPSDVTTGLGFTPYNAANPSGYQTAANVTASLAPYALTSAVPAASSTNPLMDGTAAIGSLATYAKADHVHPTDTTRYAASNPSGYINSAGAPVQSVATRTGAVTLTHADITDWAATLAPYALISAVPVASTTTPVMSGAGAVGTGTTWARADHQHPSDTSRAPVASPTFTGVPAAPNAALSTSTTQIATTAFVIGQASTTTPNMSGAGAIGTGVTYARADHQHPSDTSRFPAAGGTLTGGVVVQGPADLIRQAVTASSASLSINRSLGENVALTLSATVSTFTVTNWPASGTTGKLRLVIASTGAFNVTGWPAGTIWPGGTAPTITSGSGKKDIILLMSDDGGTTIFGSIVGQDYR